MSLLSRLNSSTLKLNPILNSEIKDNAHYSLSKIFGWLFLFSNIVAVILRQYVWHSSNHYFFMIAFCYAKKRCFYTNEFWSRMLSERSSEWLPTEILVDAVTQSQLLILLSYIIENLTSQMLLINWFIFLRSWSFYASLISIVEILFLLYR